jgi:hypothetical protein
MKNIKITNMENGSVIIVERKIFNSIKNNLSENSVYEETDEPTTMITARIATRGKYNRVLNSLIDLIRQGEFTYENYRTTIV